MQVGIVGIIVPDNDILGVFNPHFLHIFFGQLDHEIISQPVAVFGRKGNRDMPDRLLYFFPAGTLHGKTADDILLRFRPNTICFSRVAPSYMT